MCSYNTASDFWPCWAPNQALVAFTTERDGNREVYITKPNAAEVYNLTKNHSQEIASD
jgi:Tol biopolymer transport system component